MSQRTYIETTRVMPCGGVVLSAAGRAFDSFASEHNWKSGWRRG